TLLPSVVPPLLVPFRSRARAGPAETLVSGMVGRSKDPDLRAVTVCRFRLAGDDLSRESHAAGSERPESASAPRRCDTWFAGQLDNGTAPQLLVPTFPAPGLVFRELLRP